MVFYLTCAINYGLSHKYDKPQLLHIFKPAFLN